MLLQRLHFLRRLILDVIIYRLKKRVEHSTRFFDYWAWGTVIRSSL